MLQGMTWPDVIPQLAILLGWLALCFLLALKLFRWK